MSERHCDACLEPKLANRIVNGSFDDVTDLVLKVLLFDDSEIEPDSDTEVEESSAVD